MGGDEVSGSGCAKAERVQGDLLLFSVWKWGSGGAIWSMVELIDPNEAAVIQVQKC